MRVNEIWPCNKVSPEQTLKIMMNENDADSGMFEVVTLESLGEHYENQDRFDPNDISIRDQIRIKILNGDSWYWFSVHC